MHWPSMTLARSSQAPRSVRCMSPHPLGLFGLPAPPKGASPCVNSSQQRLSPRSSLWARWPPTPVFRRATQSVTRAVSGKAVHYFTTAIIHSETPTATGKIQRSTDLIELTGDLKGRVLYHPTSVFDFVKGTLVNTGNQVFSGTVLGSAPVLLHDDEFRFEVDLKTGGLESGEVHLTDRIAGPKIRCDLVAVRGRRKDAGRRQHRRLQWHLHLQKVRGVAGPVTWLLAEQFKRSSHHGHR